MVVVDVDILETHAVLEPDVQACNLAILALLEVDLLKHTALRGRQDDFMPQAHQLNQVAVGLQLGWHVDVAGARQLDLRGRNHVLNVDCLVSALSLRCVHKRLLVLDDDPVGRLDPILVLHLVLAVLFRHTWELKEIYRVHVQLRDQVRVQGRFGCHSELGDHLFGVEDHLVGVAHD